jgi:hypothetical protein
LSKGHQFHTTYEVVSRSGALRYLPKMRLCFTTNSHCISSHPKPGPFRQENFRNEVIRMLHPRSWSLKLAIANRSLIIKPSNSIHVTPNYVCM